MKLVATTIKDITIEHIDSGNAVSLPRKDTKLWNCLIMLHNLERAKTSEITDRLNLVHKLNLTVSDVASYLTVLKYKGLVKTLNHRKGFSGGSTWELTMSAVNLLG